MSDKEVEKAGNISGDEYFNACVKCGGTCNLSQFAHRNGRGQITGWIYACPGCREKVSGVDIEEVFGYRKPSPELRKRVARRLFYFVLDQTGKDLNWEKNWKAYILPVADQILALIVPKDKPSREKIARIICCFAKENNSCAECKENIPGHSFPDFFCSIGCVSTLGLSLRFQVPPPATPISLKPLAIRLLPNSDCSI